MPQGYNIIGTEEVALPFSEINFYLSSSGNGPMGTLHLGLGLVAEDKVFMHTHTYYTHACTPMHTFHSELWSTPHSKQR